MAFFEFLGQRLFYRERGCGSLLVILPGNTASSACHEGELEHFSRTHRTVCLDLPGTGQSARMDVWPDEWWRLGAQAAVALGQHLGEEPFVAMGTSGGAIVALLAAIHHPDSIRAVVADSFVSRFEPSGLRTRISERQRRTPEQVGFWTGAHGPDWEQVVDADTDLLRRFAARGADWFGDSLARLSCPVLVTASLTDEMLENVAGQTAELLRSVPQAVVVMAGAGSHPLMWSNAAVFRLHADAFLAGLG